jgi:hypothetical protein
MLSIALAPRPGVVAGITIFIFYPELALFLLLFFSERKIVHDFRE